jgi:hypothetical protein
MIECLGFLVYFQCSTPKPVVIDSFCSSYQRVIRSPADAAISGPLAPKQRMAANEITYRCTCEGWKSPLCKHPTKK